MVITVINIRVRPEKRREIEQTLCSIVEHVSKQRGCLNTCVYQNLENDDDYLVVEKWATQKDLEDHLQSDIFTVFVGAGSLMIRKPEIVAYMIQQSKELSV